MSSFNPNLPHIEINEFGRLFVRGEYKGVVTLETVFYGSLNNAEVAKKIAQKFHGQCICTNEWGTEDPVFIFTVNAGPAVKHVTWFLRMVRRSLDEIVKEVDLLYK